MVLDGARRTLSQTNGRKFFRIRGSKKREPLSAGSLFESTISQLLRILPATISSATSITAVPIPATATPASPAAPATTSTAKAPATTATASRSCSTTASAFTRRTSFVDDDIAAHKIVAVQPLDGALGFLIAIDLDKSEPAWLS